MRYTSIFLLICSFAVHLSFTSKTDIAGVYGVSDSNPANIRLTLNEDYTFEYQDYSVPSEPIKTAGNWVLNKETVQLVNFASEYKFHTKWKITSDGKFIKSRKGITFYSLKKL